MGIKYIIDNRSIVKFIYVTNSKNKGNPVPSSPSCVVLAQIGYFASLPGIGSKQH